MRYFRKREPADPFAAFSERYGVRLPKTEPEEAPAEDEPLKDEPESAGPLWAHSALGFTNNVENGIARSLLGRLLSEGKLPSPEKASRRLGLGYPTWLALENLGAEEVLAALARATGIPVLEWPLTKDVLDLDRARICNPKVLRERRWVPLVDGRTAVADPFGLLPDEPGARGLCLAWGRDIDRILGEAFPDAEGRAEEQRRIGRMLLDAGQISERDLALALEEQERSGGEIGEILLAQGAVDPSTLTDVLTKELALPSLEPGERPIPVMRARLARSLRAVVLSGERAGRSPVPVAFIDPSEAKVEAVRTHLGAPVAPKLTDEETLNRLLGEAYAEEEVEQVVTLLRERRPHLSAYSNGLSQAQLLAVLSSAAAFVACFLMNPPSVAVIVVAAASVFYVLYAVFRVYIAWSGWRKHSTISPSAEDLRTLDERVLPVYTILLPMYKEKPSTVAALFRALSRLEYPKHKLDGLLLVEADDRQTQQAVETVGKPDSLRIVDVPPEALEEAPEGRHAPERAKDASKPGWLKTLPIPPGGPRTKPKAMTYGLLYARGALLTIYDAEDQPDPLQLKKAVWTFRRLGNDGSVACLQAKLSYYNVRQNLLTRWFTLEYNAWFDMFLPGLHSVGTPIPLSGTSNHFRTGVLRRALGWDPYNVTEDADLGTRLFRMGKKTLILESTTYEEANSRLKNWMRQRSRWVKGYMQTFLVHTRHPATLIREIGVRNALAFLATVGGLIATVLISPVFWALLIVWFLAQPGWMPALFPDPIYYMAIASLVVGNFFFIFLGLAGAVLRGHDDLAPHALLIPLYWFLMSAASYLALYGLLVRPHHWQKTEHGLHFDETGDTERREETR